jgi:choline dehydrogenase-like flavoprotein
MTQFAHAQVLLALMRDGFHEQSTGGRVRLRSDSTPELDYPLNAHLWDGVRRAYRVMAEIQFAAGAREVTVVHEQAPMWSTWKAAQAGIDALDLRPLLTRVVSAHVMGGCAMGSDPKRSVTDSRGRVHGLQNLQVADGSLFPTSLGANPQETIYATVRRQITQWLRET